MKPRVLYVPPPIHTARAFRPETYATLCAEFDVQASGDGERLTSEQVAERVAGFDAVVTGWGSPPFTPAVFEAADRLRIVAHSAGSVRHLFAFEVVEKYVRPRGITIFSANGAIALNVAEYTIAAMILVPRRLPDQIVGMRIALRGDPEVPPSTTYLRGASVGLVSASVVGREVIRLLAPFDARVSVYDPFLTEEDARVLGVARAGLDEIFANSDIVSLHAPSIPATRHMIGAAQLRLLRDGAALINTSRGSVIDHDALFQEAKGGRIRVMLDVTDPEPLPIEHPLRSLPNVYMTPHVSGAGAYGYGRIGEWTVQALRDGLAGRPVYGAVPLARYEQLA